MRLFTGLSIPSHIITQISGAIGELREVTHLRWSPVENLHITTKFIGEWPEDRLPELMDALGLIPSPDPFGVTVARFGFLPNPNHPKIFFAGVHGDAGLAELAALTESTAASLGVKREERAYAPHLTLARIGQDHAGLQTLRERIARLTAEGSAFEFGSFTVEEFHLYQSEPGPAGSVYSVLASYPLPKAA